MSFQTSNTFVHLQNTNEDILIKSESFLTPQTVSNICLTSSVLS